MGLQVGKDVFGVAKQSAKGSIAANPYFAMGLAGGGLKIDPQQEPDKLTSAYLSPAGAYRSRIENGGEIESRAYQKSVGLFLLGVLGAISTTGPVTLKYTHVITLGDLLDYFTVFEKKGDDSLHAVQDCKIDELKISWSENAPLALAATFVGGAWSEPATFTPTVSEMDTTDYFTPVGGTFKYAVDSATPAEAAILGGEITISRDCEAKYFSGAIGAGDVFEGSCNVEVGLTVIPDDMELWRTMLTGTSSGAAIMGTPLYGSFEHTFVKGTDSLKLAGANCAFLAGFPEADPEGGAAEMDLAGIAYRSAGTPITATLINTQASY